MNRGCHQFAIQLVLIPEIGFSVNVFEVGEICPGGDDFHGLWKVYGFLMRKGGGVKAIGSTEFRIFAVVELALGVGHLANSNHFGYLAIG